MFSMYNRLKPQFQNAVFKDVGGIRYTKSWFVVHKTTFFWYVVLKFGIRNVPFRPQLFHYEILLISTNIVRNGKNVDFAVTWYLVAYARPKQSHMQQSGIKQ